MYKKEFPLLESEEILKKDLILMDYDITPEYLSTILNHFDKCNSPEDFNRNYINILFQTSSEILKYGTKPNIFVTDISRQIFGGIKEEVDKSVKITKVSKDKYNYEILKKISGNYKKLNNQTKIITKGIDESELMVNIESVVDELFGIIYKNNHNLKGDLASATMYFSLKGEPLSVWTHNRYLPIEVAYLEYIFQNKGFDVTSPEIYTAEEHDMPKIDIRKFNLDPEKKYKKILFRENKELKITIPKEVANHNFSFVWPKKEQSTKSITGIDFEETNLKILKRQINLAKRTLKKLNKYN